MTYLPHLRLLLVSAIFIAATFGSVFGQTPILSAEGELARVVQLIREGKRDEALKHAKRAVNKDESNAEARYYLGIVYLQLNDFKKATEAFQRAIRLQPNLAASTHAQFAYAQVLRGNLKTATPEARRALEIDPNDPDALYTMALINVRTYARDEALKNVDLLIVLKPEFAESYLLKSMALVSMNGGVPLVDEQRPDRLLRYQLAADALEQYLKMTSDPQATKLWQEQLESLRFYLLAEQPGSTEAYTGRQVSTKARVIEKPEPSYTDPARAELVVGTVVLRCVFGADGKVQHILIVQSLTHGLTEASIGALRKIKFNPAILDGRPVPVFMQLEYNYNLY